MRISDWSSDVCSSDLQYEFRPRDRSEQPIGHGVEPGGGARPVARADRGKGRPVIAAMLRIEMCRNRAGRRRLGRKSVVQGRSVSARVDLGGRSSIKKQRKSYHTKKITKIQKQL